MEWCKTLLDMASNIPDINDKTRILKRKMETLASREADIRTQLNTEEKRPTKKRKEEVKNWLNRLDSLRIDVNDVVQKAETSNSLWQLRLGSSLDKLITEVEGLHKDGSFSDGLTLDVEETQGCELPVEEIVGQAFQSNREKIWEYLMSEKVQSIGVYGMGGVGKTTLVTHIHNKIVNDHVKFESSYWVTVSQDCNVRKLQYAIAEHIHLDLTNEKDEKIRAGKLWRALNGRKFIIILDDVWQYYALKNVGIPLERNGSKLILTSRKKDVCYQMKCDKLVEVATLLEQEAWCLFQDNLGCDFLLSPNVEEIAQAVAKECAGLPLGIVVLSGIMRGVNDIHEWRNTLTELQESKFNEERMEDEVFRVLRFSYQRLNNSILQQCFLHIALYAEDEEVCKEELIQYFIDYGLIEREGTKRARFDKGNAILNKLVKSCLLEEGRKNSAHVKMHDLVRDMAINVTKGCFMVKAGQRLRQIPNDNEWIESLEKVSLMSNAIEEIIPNASPRCYNISTLFLQKNPLQSIPDSFFKHMQVLQILNLSGTNIEELPSSFSNLQSLTALNLSGCSKLRYVPSLAKMKALRSLMLNSTGIKEIPQGIERLHNLTFLCLHHTYRLEGMQWPTRILPQLSHLQHLDFMRGPKILKAEELMSLRKLEVLYCWFDDADEFCTFMTYLRDRAPHVSTWGIALGPSHTFDIGVRVVGMSTSLFGDAHWDFVHFDFNEVAIVDCNMEGRAESFRLPDDVHFLALKDCAGVTSMSQLGTTFPKLEQLYLLDLRDLRVMISNSPQLAMTTGMGSLFSSLKELIMWGCPRIKLLMSHCLPLLTNVKIIVVADCAELEEIISIEDDNHDDAILGLPKLQRIRLEGLPQLKRVCGAKWMMKCDSLLSLHILRCPKLERIPMEFHIPSRHHREEAPIPSSLQSVHISSVPGWSNTYWDYGNERRCVSLLQF